MMLLACVKRCIPFVFSLLSFFSTSAECPSGPELFAKIQKIEAAPASTVEKLSLYYSLRKEAESCKRAADSVTALLYHKLAIYEYRVNNNSPTEKTIQFSLRSIAINKSGIRSASEYTAMNSYSNLGIFYTALRLYNQALACYDSATHLFKKYPHASFFYLVAKYDRSGIFSQLADFYHCIEESTLGLYQARSIGDTSWILKFLNQRALAYFYYGSQKDAFSDVNEIIAVINKIKETPGAANRKGAPAPGPLGEELLNQLAYAYRTKALLYEKEKKPDSSKSYYIKCITLRTNCSADCDYSQLPGYYIDLGNFYVNSTKEYLQARNCYTTAISYAKRSNDFTSIAKAFINLGDVEYKTGFYYNAAEYYHKALKEYKVPCEAGVLFTPSADNLNIIQDNEVVLTILDNRVQLLTSMFKNERRNDYLQAAIQTALVADTIITRARHSQIAEPSKLYWRSFTRSFYANVLEVAFLAKKESLAFLFMEKSRAALLLDRLNELGANATLPVEEALRQQEFTSRIINEQNKLNELPQNSQVFKEQQVKVIAAREELERYIRLLENRYPAYYQYKYSDATPGLAALQNYLRRNKKSFAHYFLSDTVAYAVGITGDDIKMFRVTEKDGYSSGLMSDFMKLCSDKQLLNANYPRFISHGFTINKILFQPLGFKNKSVVVCLENILIPFETLFHDPSGSRFLINDHAFSYVYSAAYLLKSFPSSPPKGNFIGFAPGSFKSQPDLPELKFSISSIKAAAGNYPATALYANSRATKRNFLSLVQDYTIVNVYSHASGGSADKEPVLFMQDSIIYLSELQLLKRPATRLVVLSACETTVGKNATGEGIYSMARGMASAGIPSVAATLWKTDEAAVYAINEKFHEYLADGTPKDYALQKAKLYFIRERGEERLLPYYWANMILIGSSSPLEIEKRPASMFLLIAVPAGILLIAGIIFFNIKHKARRL